MTEEIKAFLAELTRLTRKYGIAIVGDTSGNPNYAGASLDCDNVTPFGEYVCDDDGDNLRWEKL